MKRLTLPLSDEETRALRAGEGVLLSGVIYTARDCAHKRLFALLDERKPLPVELKETYIYYAVPVPRPKGRRAGAAVPRRPPA